MGQEVEGEALGVDETISEKRRRPKDEEHFASETREERELRSRQRSGQRGKLAVVRAAVLPFIALILSCSYMSADDFIVPPRIRP